MPISFEFVFALSWLLAFIFAMRGIIGIDNPADHVPGTIPNGVFYGGYLYNLSFFDTLFNSNIQSAFKLGDHLARIPLDHETIKNELVFEQMKLIYIRTIKMARHKFAFFFGAIWIICGGLIWLASLAL
jgi:hypothetical protein